MIRHFFVPLAIALLSIQSFGQFSVGADVTARLNNQFDQQNADTRSSNTTFNLNIGPTVIISFSDVIEFVPFAHLKFNNYSHFNKTQYSESTTSTNTWGFDFGGGVYYRLINGEIFGLSFGPKLDCGMMLYPDADYSDITGSFSTPANIDFKLSRSFFVRASPEIASVEFYMRKPEAEDRYNGTFTLNFITQSALNISFFYTF
jgi:hypothetical protein